MGCQALVWVKAWLPWRWGPNQLVSIGMGREGVGTQFKKVKGRTKGLDHRKWQARGRPFEEPRMVPQGTRGTGGPRSSLWVLGTPILPTCFHPQG